MYVEGLGSTFGALWGSSGSILAHIGALEGIWGGFGAQLGTYHPKGLTICHIWHPNGALWSSFWLLWGSFGSLVGSNWGPKGGKMRPRRLQGMI